MILAFALGTGLRLHELLALNVGDVVLPEGRPRSRVRLRVAKGGRAGDVFVPQRLQAKLRKYVVWKARGGESLATEAPLFASMTGRRLSKRRTQQVFRIWQERAGLDQRHTFHTLRHTSINAVYRSTGGPPPHPAVRPPLQPPRDLDLPAPHRRGSGSIGPEDPLLTRLRRG